MKAALILCFVFQTAVSSGIQGNVLLKDTYPVSALSDVNYGWGFSSITLKETYNKVADVSMMSKKGTKSTIEAVYRIRLCKTSYEYNRYISNALSVSGTYMAVTLKPSIKVLTTVKVTKLDTVLIAHVDITTDNRVSRNPVLIPRAQKIMDKSFIEFAETYGTHYLKEVILGGKMILAMRFSSETREAKTKLEAKLGAYVGGFSKENEFSTQLSKLKENYSMEVYLLAQGGNVPPPHPDVGKGLEYAIKFAKSAMQISVVKEVHYTGIWTIPGIPKEFKQKIFPLQATTESVLKIGQRLWNVDQMIRNFYVLRSTEKAFFSSEAWEKFDDYQRTAKRLYQNLELDLRVTVTTLENLKSLYDKYKGKGKYILTRIDQLVKAESSLAYGDEITLRSMGTRLYISRDSNRYPTLTASSPIPLTVKEEHGKSSKNIHYGMLQSYYLQSPRLPGHSMCMRKNNWYVFWVPNENIRGDKNCLWSFFSADKNKNTDISFGDKVLIYNRGFSDYVMGVSKDRKWLEDIPAARGSEPDHHWYVGKYDH